MDEQEPFGEPPRSRIGLLTAAIGMLACMIWIFGFKCGMTA